MQKNGIKTCIFSDFTAISSSKCHDSDLKFTIFSQKWPKNRFLDSKYIWYDFWHTFGWFSQYPWVKNLIQNRFFDHFWLKIVIFRSKTCNFWTKNSCKITKNPCFHPIFLHKIAQKGPQMYVETSSIHKCGKIWINSIETFLSTFEISQSHIISYLPKTKSKFQTL